MIWNRRKLLCLAWVIVGLLITTSSSAEIEGYCTLCHKYPGLGRVDKINGSESEEIKRVFYINNNLYEQTYHGAIRCRSCHTDVTRFPHNGVGKVDCATDCHITDPSSNKPFSHKKIVSDFNASVHGEEGSQTPYKEDLPVCKDCHSNKAYHAEYEEQVEAMTFLNVCDECHKSGTFTQRFYEHISYRTTKRRSSKEVVRLCSTCHADQKLMDRHELDVVVGFYNTFHAKAISYGSTRVPNCLNCHAPYQLGFSPHRITSKNKENSPTYPENKHATCSQVGCHIAAKEDFATGGFVHASDTKIAMSNMTNIAVEDPEESARTRFQNKIVGWIELFYKILIALVISGLGLHRILDAYAGWREKRREVSANEF